jgi:hypothetical protein
LWLATCRHGGAADRSGTRARRRLPGFGKQNGMELRTCGWIVFPAPIQAIICSISTYNNQTVKYTYTRSIGGPMVGPPPPKAHAPNQTKLRQRFAPSKLADASHPRGLSSRWTPELPGRFLPSWFPVPVPDRQRQALQILLFR